MPEQNSETRRLVGIARRDVPHYGDGKTALSELDVFLLTDRFGVRVVREEIEAAWLLTPRPPAGRDLHVRASLPDLAQDFAALAQCARMRLGSQGGARRTAECFAAVGLYPLLIEGTDDLRELDGEWYATVWPRVWADAQRVVLGTDRKPSLPAAELYDLGAEARTKKDYRMAAALFADAAAAGECEGDWLAVARAWTALGTVEWRDGRFSEARKLYRRALTTTEEHRLYEQRPRTLHDAFSLEADDGREDAALDFAAQALAAYDPASQGFLWFAHDVAWCLTDRGMHLRALPLLRHLATAIEDKSVSTCALGNLAVAAAGAGDGDVFAAAAVRLEAAAMDDDGNTYAPAWYLAVAEGALMLNEWDRAERAAECALIEAVRLRRRAIEARAKRAMDAARARYSNPRSTGRLPADILARWDALAVDVGEALFAGCLPAAASR